MVRMFPLNVLVPTKAMLDLRLPPSGRPEQVRSPGSPLHSTTTEKQLSHQLL
jgi:hypothetical protein